MAVVHTLLNKSKRLTAVLLHLLNDGDHELGVHIGDLLDLFRVIFLGLRAFHTLMQILSDLVLTDLMGECTFFGIHGAFIRKVLLQANGRRTVQPLLGTGCAQKRMNVRHLLTSDQS